MDSVQSFRCPSCGCRLDVSEHLTMSVGSHQSALLVAKSIAERLEIPWVNIVGRGRSRWLVDARSVIAKELRARTKLSLAEIGKVLGNRDHTTVMNLLKR